VEAADFNQYLRAIRNIVETGKINERTKRFFSLSYVDQKIAACSIAHGFKLTTVDDDLNDFVTQEFAGKTISPLEIVNDWIKKGLKQKLLASQKSKSRGADVLILPQRKLPLKLKGTAKISQRQWTD